SRGLRIFGSGTVSTRTSPLPYQHTAFILCPPCPFSAGYALCHLRIVRCWGLARLDNLFETAQILFELLFSESLEEVANCHSHHAAWRCIFEPHPHFRTAAIREFPETHGAGMVHVRPRQGTPGQQGIFPFGDNVGVPLDGCWQRCFGDPVRPFAIGACHRLEMPHKARMIFQVAPEPIDLCGGFIDRDGRAERYTVACVTMRRIHSQGLVCCAMTRETAVYQGASTEH